MTMDNGHENGDDPAVPEDLARDLGFLVRPAYTPRAAIDDDILAGARRRLGPIAAGRRRRRSIVRLVPLAAAAVLLIWLVVRPGAVREDLDGNGRVDVLDAFLLARALRDGGNLEKAWDLDHDGRVDRHDVDLVLERARRL